jgi:hypothetical protein
LGLYTNNRKTTVLGQPINVWLTGVALLFFSFFCEKLRENHIKVSLSQNCALLHTVLGQAHVALIYSLANKTTLP